MVESAEHFLTARDTDALVAEVLSQADFLPSDLAVISDKLSQSLFKVGIDIYEVMVILSMTGGGMLVSKFLSGSYSTLETRRNIALGGFVGLLISTLASIND